MAQGDWLVSLSWHRVISHCLEHSQPVNNGKKRLPVPPLRLVSSLSCWSVSGGCGTCHSCKDKHFERNDMWLLLPQTAKHFSVDKPAILMFGTEVTEDVLGQVGQVVEASKSSHWWKNWQVGLAMLRVRVATGEKTDNLPGYVKSKRSCWKTDKLAWLG